MNVRILLATAAVIALGISAIATAHQTPAAGGTTAIVTVVPTDFDTTWDVLVTELDEGDFTINATIKENSTIRVYFSSRSRLNGSIAVAYR